MRKKLYKGFSVLMVVAVLFSSTMVSFASGAGAAVGTFVATAFGDWVISKSLDYGSEFIKDLIGYSAGKECKSSSDGYHHSSRGYGFDTGKQDENGRYNIAKCQYCEQEFKLYASDLEQSYSAQVSALPANGIDSSGGLIYSVPFTYLRAGWQVNDHYSMCYMSFGDDPTPGTATQSEIESNIKSSIVDFSASASAYDVSFSRMPYSTFNTLFGFKAKVPLTGTYTPIQKVYDFNYWDSDGKHTQSKDIWDPSSDIKATYLTKDSYLPSPFEPNVRNSTYYIRVAISMPPLTFQVIPDDTSIVQGDTYTINSRPTSITGDYGIIGDNGQITKVEGNTIVNETNNTYYNPATGTTDTITDWSYNYEDRSYTLTLGGGTTSTVTYGDENVTIQEGDTTYNVYYLVEDTATDPPTPGPATPCNHDWTETSSTPPTCTVPGSKLLTCSLCGQTKTEAIPAPGHNWQIKQTVQTQYDDTGQLTQEGYTIFECSVCQEQYKTTDGGAPPGGSTGPGTGSGSAGGVFSGVFGLLVDFLGFFWTTFRGFVGEGVKGFLTALMDGTSAIFGLLNPFEWGG